MKRKVLDPFVRSDNTQVPSLNQLNDSVYEFHSPPDGTSLSSEIIFFHGLEPGDYSQAYVETWTSFSDSTGICWPQTLLAEDFPRARILSVSYDSSIESGPRQGKMDLYLTAENLLEDLLGDAKVAKNPGIPVILVGKDLGGLVIKAICMKAKARDRSQFLSNLKGIFYYGTPHVGIENLPTAFNGALAKRLAFGNKNIARLSSDFSNLRKNKWRTRAVISLQRSKKVPELVISEASQRSDADECYMSNYDIDTVCKCQGTKSSSFKFLTGFISTIQEKGSRGLLFESSPDRGGIEEGLAFKTSLSFGDDENYVPMATTRADVEDALQIARIVILHGAPGSGKSSLARHLALRFEGTAQQQCAGVAAACSAEQRSWVPNGVVYMTCGKGAEIPSMQRELLRKFNIKVSLLYKSTTLEERGGAVELLKIQHQKLVDHLSKLRFRVVVVLDDVWDSRLLENLLVPGDHVRYLLTTQISTLWNAHDSKTIRMQDVTLEDARRILGNYAKFEGGVISKELESLADEIIAATGFHPLALATLGVVLDNIGRTAVDWQELKDNLQELLETEDYPPSSFGQKYPLSVGASMTLVLDLLDEDAKKLLYKITLFDGPFIPETLLRLFLKFTLPRDVRINISKTKMSLVAKGLVQIESQMLGVLFETRVLLIHSLRQHFILTVRAEEIGKITEFLNDDNEHKFLRSGKRSELDFATALCALYGATHIKKRARKKMGSHFIWSEEYSDGLASALKPFVSLMLSEGDTKSRTSQAAIEVFWNILICSTIDDLHIQTLLHEQECIALTCHIIAALGMHNHMLCHKNQGPQHSVRIKAMTLHGTISKLISFMSSNHGTICAAAVEAIGGIAMDPQNRLTIVQFPSSLQRLVALLVQDVDQTIVEQAVLCLISLVDCDNRVNILQIEFLLERLVNLLSTNNTFICAHVAQTIGKLALALENRLVIVRFPSCFQRLVALLGQDVNETIVERVVWCLTYLVDCDDRVNILQTEFFLERLVDLLSTKNTLICERATHTIGELAQAPENRLFIVRFPLCLHKLVALLVQDVDQTIVEEVVWCLTYLVDCDDRVNILQTEFFFKRLVDLLSIENTLICERATYTIGQLAIAPENRVMIVQFPSCLQRLVALLVQDVDETIVEAVAWCFIYLVDCDDGVNILQTEFFLERLVVLLSMKNKLICERVAFTIRHLAKAPENRLVIVRFPSCLQRLVALLVQDVDETIVEEVLSCLTYLVDCDDRVDILQTKFFFERLVDRLSTENISICANAAHTVGELAQAPENRLFIVQFPSCLQRLVALLVQDVDETIVEEVLSCLTYLVDCDDQVDILQTEFFFERLVDRLSTKNISICASAAHTIGELAQAPENRLFIVQFPSCLQRLVALLVQDVDETIVEEVVWCFTWLVDCDDRVNILQIKFFFERLVDLLSTKNTLICERVAQIVGQLAEAPENRLVIVRFPSCLQRLVALLVEDVDQTIVEEVVWCLTYLVDCDDRVNILQTEFLLKRLVDFLSTKNTLICERAAQIIGELAQAPENRVEIVRFPSCLQRLVALLVQDVDETIVEVVVWCLRYLVDCGDRVDILQTEFFLKRLVDLLSMKNTSICEKAAHTIGELAQASENRLFIVRFPSCLQRLVALLVQDVDEKILERVLSCLAYLVDCDDKEDVLKTPLLLERVKVLLSCKDNTYICRRGAQIMDFVRK